MELKIRILRITICSWNICKLIFALMQFRTNYSCFQPLYLFSIHVIVSVFSLCVMVVECGMLRLWCRVTVLWAAVCCRAGGRWNLARWRPRPPSTLELAANSPHPLPHRPLPPSHPWRTPRPLSVRPPPPPPRPTPTLHQTPTMLTLTTATSWKRFGGMVLSCRKRLLLLICLLAARMLFFKCAWSCFFYAFCVCYRVRFLFLLKSANIK